MSEFADANAGMIGLVFFVATFAVIALWAYAPGNRAKLEAHKMIPLEEGPTSDDQPGQKGVQK